MKLVAGLGNPGKNYERARHNLGFMIVDQIARRNQVTIKKSSAMLWSASGGTMEKGFFWSSLRPT